jgi:hypothetical protein
MTPFASPISEGGPGFGGSAPQLVSVAVIIWQLRARVCRVDLGVVWTAVGSVAAVGSVIAAWLATRSAHAARQGELEAARIRDLENRISERKYEVYKPMLDYIGHIFSQPNEESRRALADQAAVTKVYVDFSRWLAIYGSDEALTAYHNLMQGINYGAPPLMLNRLMTDFLLAARRDIGNSASKTRQTELFTVAFRITDFYDQGDLAGQIMRLPLKKALKKAGWSPPWSSMKAGPPVVQTPDAGTSLPNQPNP